MSLYQEQLDSFLESAQKLEIEGLLGCDNQENIEDSKFRQDDNEDVNIEVYKEKEAHDERRLINTDGPAHAKKSRQSVRVPHNDIEKFEVGLMTAEEIDVKIRELYQKVDGVWTCLACDYTSSRMSSGHIRRHIETHLDGLSYTCNMCNKEFRSQHCFNEHKRKFHKYSNK